MIVMKQELVSDKAVENYVKKEVARELKKELLRRSRSITGHPFIDTNNPVFMRKLKLRLEPITARGRNMIEVYHESLPYPIFRYVVTPFSTHTLNIHKNGTMTECEYPAVAFSNKDSLDWKLFDLKIIFTNIVKLDDTLELIRRFYRDATDNWYKNNLNMVIPFIQHKPEGVYIHMYRSRKFSGLQKSAAIYDSKGRLFMFMGVDALIANKDVLENYTESEFYKAAIYLSIITDKASDIILTDGAFKVRTHESKIGYSELVSTVGLEYGIKYGMPTIIDTYNVSPEDLDFKNAMMNKKRKRRNHRRH